MNPDKATISQNRASEPLASTWLSANAGSGKTKVLTDRVARLLLSGVSPQNILCLTYTKAAANEMQNRLFKLLGNWAMKSDAQLGAELEKLGEDPTQDLASARRLFARAIETPGGLKIQTIHSFCSALLRRFSLEAGVSPQFKEMDDRAQLILREDVVEAMAMGEGHPALADLATFYSGQDFGALTKGICAKRHHFTSETSHADIWGQFGLTPDFDDSALLETVFRSSDMKLLSDLVPALRQGSVRDQNHADQLATLGPKPKTEHLKVLESIFLTGKLAASPFAAKIGSFPTKKTQAGPASALMPAIEALMLRVESARLPRISLYSAQKTHALHQFARPFLKEYEARKIQHGWVDFDDLIEKAGDLLSTSSLAAWVLFKLDGGIDHILVDEAQDTSPAQWKVIRLLAQEFTSGKGAREVERTMFVVGDPKQSIYSFQGAEPAAFKNMQEHFDRQLSEIGKRLENRRLEHSFRSAPAILRLADFALRDLPGLGHEFNHIAYFNEKPGRVDLWPVIENTSYEENRDWFDTSDLELPQTHMIQLARAVANEVKRLVAEESLMDGDGNFRPVSPGDILILVRKRTGELFSEIIRACKELGVPIAGADRMRIGAELAVKDLTALLRFLATPEDDLSLAAALRSPLFGLSEATLFDIAHNRPDGQFLWAALRDKALNYPDCVEMLTSLRNDADFLRPYELLERILTKFQGRSNLLARLGNEAEDGIDALLNQALTFENTQTPSLTGFLEWLDVMEVEVKRQVDNASDQIRVMTIHGAKGLEAPIVFLPDTGKYKAGRPPELIEPENRALVWKPLSNEMPQDLEETLNAIRAAEEQELSRLLYVATTRAESWLIIAAAGDVGTGPESWYNILAKGMEEAGAVSTSTLLGEGWRFETGKWATSDKKRRESCQDENMPLPDWATNPVTTPKEKPAPLNPSGLGGAKVMTGEGAGLSTEAAKRRGLQIHLLLEVLPGITEEKWPGLCENLLDSGALAATKEEAGALCKEVTSLLKNPSLAHIFAADTLAEVDISAFVPVMSGLPIQGVIDRLIISAEKVVVIDFKSNAVVPQKADDIPEGILRQMGAYVQALEQVFPKTKVECEILWTENAELMPIPSELAIAALAAS